MEISVFDVKISASGEFLDIKETVLEYDDHSQPVAELREIQCIARKSEVHAERVTDIRTNEVSTDLLVQGYVVCTFSEFGSQPFNKFDGESRADRVYDGITRFMGF